MQSYMRKVKQTLLLGLVIIVVCLLIYLVVPKYQIHSVRVDDDTVVVTRINTITGETLTKIEYGTIFKYDGKGKLDFEFND